MNIYAPEEFFSNEIIDGERLNRNNEHLAAAVGQRLGDGHINSSQAAGTGFARAALAFPDSVNSISFRAQVAAANDVDLRTFGLRAPVAGRILGADLCQYATTSSGGATLFPIRLVPFGVQALVEAKVYVSAASFYSGADTGVGTEDTLAWKTSYVGVNAPGSIYSYSYGIFMRSRANAPYPAGSFAANDFITVRVVAPAGFAGTVIYGVTLNVAWQVAALNDNITDWWSVTGGVKVAAQGHIEPSHAGVKPHKKEEGLTWHADTKSAYSINNPVLGAGE